MSEHLRAFIFITVLMALAFFISRKLFAQAVEPKFVERLFGAGYCATAIMFLAHNMWLFLGGLGLLSVLMSRRFAYPLALFVFLLLLIPDYFVRVPGFGLINYLIDLHAWRVLALTVLLPAAVYLLHRPDLPKPGQLLVDKLIIAFVLYVSVLNYLHQDTFTGGLRQLIIETLDYLLLYFVASRSLMQKGAVRHVMVALVMAAIYLSLAGAFEFAKKWMLYSSVKQALGSSSAMFGYLFRGDVLRASVTTGQPIVFGFIMMMGFLLTFYVQRLVLHGWGRTLLWGLMSIGLIAAMSRGPWVGAVIGMIVVALLSTKPVSNLFNLMAGSLAVMALLLILPGGEKIIDYLPWIGAVDAQNITYREILWEQTKLVVDSHFWIGSVGFTKLPEFDVIRTSNGFVDIVNSYIGVLLKYGVIGLHLYALFIILPILKNLFLMLKMRGEHTERHAYGVALMGTLVAIAITIVTVSSISQISPLVIFLTAAGVANAHQYQLLQKMSEPRATYRHHLPVG